MITLIDSMEILLSEKGARKFFNDIIKINENKRLSNKFLTLEDIRNIESSSPISYYIKKYEPIDDPEEEIELVKKYQKKKDPKAFDRLIRAQSKYILKLIMNNKRKLEKIDPNISTEEVFNVMIINFAKAINKFDTEKGARFYTYLRQWLNEVILNPRRFITKSTQEIGRRSKSMDRKIGKGDDQKTIRDLIADPDAVDMYSDREKEKFMSDILKRGLKALSKNEKFVIQAKYDLLDDSNIEKQLKSGKGKVTNATIGNYLGISAPAVHKLHKNALRKLKSAIK